MRIPIKFKRGAGTIIAFFILAVVFASMAGVVFVAINGQSKNPEALTPIDPCTADFNKDGVINSGDQLLLAQHVVSRKGQANYDPAFDINKDGIINSGDQLRLALIIKQGLQCDANKPKPDRYELYPPTIDGNNVTFRVSPSAAGNVSLLVNGSSIPGGSYLSPPISGETVMWKNAPLGTFSAFLVIVENGAPIREASNTQNFVVKGYELQQPAFSGNNVSFGISPAASGNVALLVDGQDGYISPLITGDKVEWKNAPLGLHKALLVVVEGGNPVREASNTVSFTVQGYQISIQSIQGNNVAFHVSPGAVGNVALLVDGSGTDRYLSPMITGDYVEWKNAPLGSHRALLVVVENGNPVREASNSLSFDVRGYNLYQPTVNSSDVLFRISPPAVGNVSLLVSGNDIPGGRYLSPPITGESVVWQNAPAGTFNALLVVVEGGNPVREASNSQSFTVIPTVN